MCLFPGRGIVGGNPHNGDVPDRTHDLYCPNIGIAMSHIRFGNQINRAGTAGFSTGFEVNLFLATHKINWGGYGACTPNVLDGWLRIDSKLDLGVQFNFTGGFTGIRDAVAINVLKDCVPGGSLKLNPNQVIVFARRIFCGFKIVIELGGLVVDGRPLGPIHEPGNGKNDQDDDDDDAGDNLSDGGWFFVFSHIREAGVKI